MNPTPPNLSAIAATAAEWLARRDAGLTPETEREFRAWLAADPRHTAAFRQLDATWHAFDAPRARGRAEWMIGELSFRQRRRTRRRVGAAVASVTAVAAVWLVASRPWQGSTADELGLGATGAVVWHQPERQILPDGSVIELNRGARVAVHFTPARRDVELLAGEANFTVAKNPARPFVVSTPASQFRAVGTVFAVTRQSAGSELIVTEGKVAAERPASPASGAPAPVLVTAGQGVSVPAAQSDAVTPLTLTPAEIDRRLSWRAPRLELSATSLPEVAAAFNRVNAIKLRVASPALAKLRLTGTFRADRLDAFVELLQAHYGVRATRPSTTEIVLEATPPA